MGRVSLRREPVLYTVLWERISIERKKVQVLARSMTEAEIKTRELKDTDVELVTAKPLNPIEYIKVAAERHHK